MKKRLFSTLLALCMALTLFPAAAFADDETTTADETVGLSDDSGVMALASDENYLFLCGLFPVGDDAEATVIFMDKPDEIATINVDMTRIDTDSGTLAAFNPDDVNGLPLANTWCRYVGLGDNTYVLEEIPIYDGAISGVTQYAYNVIETNTIDKIHMALNAGVGMFYFNNETLFINMSMKSYYNDIAGENSSYFTGVDCLATGIMNTSLVLSNLDTESGYPACEIYMLSESDENGNIYVTTAVTIGKLTRLFNVNPPSFISNGKVGIAVNGVECAEPLVQDLNVDDKVVITATPSEGYHLSKLTVTDSNGKTVKDEDTVENTYTFTMPASDVDYDVLFEKDEAAPVEYTVTVICNDGGFVRYGYLNSWKNIGNGGSFKAAAGDRPSVGAVPNSGYKIGSISVNEVDLTSQLAYDADGGCYAVGFQVNGGTEVKVTFASTGNSDSSDDSSDDNGDNNSDDNNVTEPSTSGGSTTVGVTANSSTSGNTIRAEVGISDMDKAVDSAVREALRRGTAPVVEIMIRNFSSVGGLNLSMPASSLERLAEVGNSSLVITSNAADVILDHTALSALVNQATGSTITLEVAPVEAISLNVPQREAVGTAPVIDLSMVSGRTTIHDYNNGVITVSLPYTLTFGQSASDVVVYYLESYGALTPCSTSYADGKVTFTTTHLSMYVIGDKQLAAQTQKTAFTDVPATAYYADAVAWAVNRNIAYGITGTTFGPDVACTRAQIVSFLWRQAGSPKMDGANPFTDVSATDYYYDAVLWAVANKITAGSTDTTFSPNAACTRAQAMSFLYRAKGSPAVSGTNTFTDVPANEYYADAVQWAVANGVAYGTTDATFSPGQDCTRAQIMSFMYRAS